MFIFYFLFSGACVSTLDIYLMGRGSQEGSYSHNASVSRNIITIRLHATWLQRPGCLVVMNDIAHFSPSVTECGWMMAALYVGGMMVDV